MSSKKRGEEPSTPLERLVARVAAGELQDRRELLTALRGAVMDELRAYIMLDRDPLKREAALDAMKKLDAGMTIAFVIVDRFLIEYESAVVRAIEERYRLSDYLAALREVVEEVAVKTGAATRDADGQLTLSGGDTHDAA